MKTLEPPAATKSIINIKTGKSSTVKSQKSNNLNQSSSRQSHSMKLHPLSIRPRIESDRTTRKSFRPCSIDSILHRLSMSLERDGPVHQPAQPLSTICGRIHETVLSPSFPHTKTHSLVLGLREQPLNHYGSVIILTPLTKIHPIIKNHIKSIV